MFSKYKFTHLNFIFYLFLTKKQVPPTYNRDNIYLKRSIHVFKIKNSTTND